MDDGAAMAALLKKMEDLQLQINERELEVQSLRMEISELREATSTLSIWMEKLAEAIENR